MSYSHTSAVGASLCCNLLIPGFKNEFFLRAATFALCISVLLSVGFPFVVLPLLLLPALSLFPGASPAQRAKCFAVGNLDISNPVSMRIVSAVRRAIPGISSSLSRASSYFSSAFGKSRPNQRYVCSYRRCDPIP